MSLQTLVFLALDDIVLRLSQWKLIGQTDCEEKINVLEPDQEHIFCSNLFSRAFFLCKLKAKYLCNIAQKNDLFLNQV